MSDEEQLNRVPEYIDPFDTREIVSEDEILRVATTLNHFNELTKTFVEGVKPMETVRLGGAGNKICNIAMGNADTYMYP